MLVDVALDEVTVPAASTLVPAINKILCPLIETLDTVYALNKAQLETGVSIAVTAELNATVPVLINLKAKPVF